MSIPRNGNSTTTTTQACAACKYQRRKCAPDCILAPYFPHYRQKQFLNAHKLFGVSNITKIIKNLDPSDKEEAMRTIIYQSDVRANDPVGGCYRIIRELQRQIDYSKVELDFVLHQLSICRAHSHHHHHVQISEPNDPILNCEAINVDPLASYSSMQYQYLVPHHEQQVLIQNDNHLQEDVGMWALEDSSLQSSNSSLHVKHNTSVNDFDEIKIDERNGLKFEFDEIVDRSDEAGLRVESGLLEETNSIQQAQDHDLKGAATLFTLTNCKSLA